MPTLSFQKIVSMAELLNLALKPRLAEWPFLQGESADIDEILVEAKALDQENQQIKGRFRELTRLRREAESRTLDLRSRVAAQLRGKLGFTNENLLAFGIPPRKRPRKPPTVQEPPSEIVQDAAPKTSTPPE